MIVVVSGPPGSGKTTVAEMFARQHGYTLVPAGSVFREMAKEQGMTLEAFGDYAVRHSEVDRRLDKRVMKDVLALHEQGSNVLVDGRIQGNLLVRRGVRCFRVYLDAPRTVRAERISDREGTSAGDAEKAIARREESERKRYAGIYGIDLDDRSIYDLVIDSAAKTPEEVVDAIAAEVARWTR